VVFVESNRHLNGVSIDAQALFRPLSATFWVLLTCTFLGVAAFAQIMGLKQALFFLFSILLEQDANLQKRSYVIRTTVLLWAFACIVIRLAYTSSMYSYLTIEPDPKIPQTFVESVSNEKFHKFAEPADVTKVSSLINYELNNNTRKFFMTNTTNRLLKLLATKMYSLTLFKEISEWVPDLDKADPVPPFQINLLQNSNNTMFVQRECIVPLKRPNSKLKPNAVICKDEYVVANSFIYIYSYPIQIQNLNNKMEVYSAILFGNKLVFGNNEPPSFTTLHGWYAAPDLTAEMADDIVGRLQQSGIIKVWRNLQHTVVLLRSWKKIKQGLVRSIGSMNLVQIAYDIAGHMKLGRSLKQMLMLHQSEFDAVTNQQLVVVWLLFSLSWTVNVCFLVGELCYRIIGENFL